MVKKQQMRWTPREAHLLLQIFTSDLTASTPDLLLTLKGRWIIENTFKYLDFYGIDWTGSSVSSRHGLAVDR
jgi:hypothetical protein